MKLAPVSETGPLATARNAAQKRRDRNKSAGRCINENKKGTHGPATHGCRCEPCYAIHKGSRDKRKPKWTEWQRSEEPNGPISEHYKRARKAIGFGSVPGSEPAPAPESEPGSR